jgi:hypothetical protein
VPEMSERERYADKTRHHIDYCLNLLGIRVWERRCQLIARLDGEWTFLGPPRDLPIYVPNDLAALRSVGTDALRVTAWQYCQDHPGTDIREVMSLSKPFDTALDQHDS